MKDLNQQSPESDAKQQVAETRTYTPPTVTRLDAPGPEGKTVLSTTEFSPFSPFGAS